MLKRSTSERSHMASVKAMGVKVLPSTFQLPSLRATGIATNHIFRDGNGEFDGYDNLAVDYSSNLSIDLSRANQERNGTTNYPNCIRSQSFDDHELENTTEIKRELKNDCRTGQVERDCKHLIQRDRKLDETQGLNEMLKLCTDYEQQVLTEKQYAQSLGEKSSGSLLRPCNVTKIKTNGSLTSPVYIRRFAELSKECHYSSQLPMYSNGTRQMTTDDVNGGDTSSAGSFGHSSVDDVLSSHSSSEFLDKSSSNRSQSYYENEDVFTAFQSDSSDCLTSDDALENSAPVHQTPELSSFHLGKDSTNSGSSNDLLSVGDNSSDRTLQRYKENGMQPGKPSLKSELLKLKKMKLDSEERIEMSKKQIRRIDKAEEEVITKLEEDVDALQTETSSELVSMKMEEDRMAVLKDQQMELLLEAAREREECQLRLETERQKLRELEKHLKESKKRLETNSTAEMQPQLFLVLKRDREAVDTQQRIFDDLEFNLLELETRHEEEREPLQQKLAAELSFLLELKSQREATLCLIEKRRAELLHRTNVDVGHLERERHALMRIFKKERLVYRSVVERISQLLMEYGFSDEDFSTELRNGSQNGSFQEDDFYEHLLSYVPCGANEELCKTPPMRIRLPQTLMKHGQEQWQNSMPSRDASYTDDISSVQLGSDSSQLDQSKISPVLKTFSSGSEESSFYSLDGVTSLDPTGIGSMNGNINGSMNRNMNGNMNRNMNGNDEHLFKDSQGNLLLSQGGSRAVGRTLSEPVSKKLDLGSATLPYAMTDQEIRFRNNQITQARPLTRYLPIRDKSLDLRNFVESSGHSLDENCQVLVNASTCCGYLKKQGGKFRTWHKRWFVFDRNKRCLMYYIDRTESKLRRSIYFQAIMDVFVDHLRTVASPNQKLTFCLKTLDRRYYLIAPTAEAMRIWIAVLFTGAEGYQEF